MKMTAEQKARYKALLAKAEKDRTADEVKELAKLADMAKAEGYNPEEDEGEKALTPDEVKNLVDQSVQNALKAMGLDGDLIKSVSTDIKAIKSVTPDELDTVLQKHLGGTTKIDAKALAAEIQKNFTPQKGITQDELTKSLEAFAKQIRVPSQHQFGSGGGADEFPVEHRRGNMSVADKQLLNVCMMHVSKDALGKSNGGAGISRPESMDDGITAEILKNAVMRGNMALSRLRKMASLAGKAITTSGSGTGAELVNTDLSTDLQIRFYMESQLAAEMIASEIDMPSDPFKLPLITTRPTFYKGSENPGSNPTSSTPGTANPTLNAEKLIGIVDYSYESDEDSVIAVLPMIQAGLASGAADAFEGALINGDTAGTHQDSDIDAVTAHAAKSFNGFRKLALAVSGLKVDLATGGLSAANFLSLKKALLRFGMRPRDVVALAGVKGYNDLVGLDETLTADKVGSNLARILTGEAPVLYGVRILPSSQVRENLNATGVYDGATTTKGSIVLFHRPSWMVGVRRGFTVEVDVDKKQQINSVVASFRRAFIPLETPSATESNVVIGYNYTA